jgi:hypothetical protein
LPVELLEFEAQPRENDVLLKWTTVSESNNDYFEVQRSIDAENFVPVGRVNGAGNSNHVRLYELPDVNALYAGADLLYYRLHQVDFNGQSSDSEIIPVQLSASSQSFQLIHAGFDNGNDLSGSFTLGAQGIVEIVCYDLNGRLVSRTQIHGVKGVNQFSSPSQTNLSKGVYTVQLVYNEQAVAAKVPKAH